MDNSKKTRKILIPIIGTLLIIIGIVCIVLKGLSTEYIDAEGFLHENFFLLPIGFLTLFSGIVILSVIGIIRITKNKRLHNP